MSKLQGNYDKQIRWFPRLVNSVFLFIIIILLGILVYVFIKNHPGTQSRSDQTVFKRYNDQTSRPDTPPASTETPYNPPTKVPDIVFEGPETVLPKVMVVRPGTYETCYVNGRTNSYLWMGAVYMKRTYYTQSGEKKEDETLLTNQDWPDEHGLTITRRWRSASSTPCYVVVDSCPLDKARALEFIREYEQKKK